MPQINLSGIVRRRFIHSMNHHAYSARTLVKQIGLPPVVVCKVIADQNTAQLPLASYFMIAKWMQMPLVNAVLLADKQPTLTELVSLGMEVRGYCPTRAQDQIAAAKEVGISVAVFRRALHDYDTFRPSIRTCNHLAEWLSWMGFDTEDIAIAAGMIVRYLDDGHRITITPEAEQTIKPYPCACGRPGCVVPAHIPNGPHRKWRSDACRMWVKRQAVHETKQDIANHPLFAPLPQSPPIVRFIMINERPVPVRF